MKAIGKYVVIEPIKEVDVQTKGGLILAEKQREDVRYRRAKVLEPGSDVKVLKNAFEQNIKMEISYIESSNQIEDNTVDINIGMEDTYQIEVKNNISKSLEKTRFKKRLTSSALLKLGAYISR